MGIREKGFKFHYLIISLIILIMFMSIFTLSIVFPEKKEINNNITLTQHKPFLITSDEFLSKEASSGSGTIYDPYIIENYHIFSNTSNGIYITGITKQLVIRNCLIDGSVLPPDICEFHGIFLENILIGKVKITNVTVFNCQSGIHLSNVHNCIIMNSTVLKNIANKGIYIENSLNVTLSGNIFLGDGLKIDEISSYSCFVDNNLVNGKKLGFFVNKSDFNIDNDVFGQLMLTNCSSFNIKNINCLNTSTGISLLKCSNATVEDCNLQYNYLGIGILNSNNISIIKSNSSENSRSGINYWFSNNLFVEECFFQGNNHAVYCWEVTGAIINNNYCPSEDSSIFLLDSNLINVTNNNCSYSKNGIELWNTISTSLVNNSCNSNRFDGIICLNGDSLLIENNTCINNLESGIFLSYTNYSLILANNITENNYYGLKIKYISYNNTIHHNIFLSNSLASPLNSQGFDDGINNIWYDINTNEGNYWSDYTGIGFYNIDGDSNSEDIYPLII